MSLLGDRSVALVPLRFKVLPEPVYQVPELRDLVPEPLAGLCPEGL